MTEMSCLFICPSHWTMSTLKPGAIVCIFPVATLDKETKPFDLFSCAKLPT